MMNKEIARHELGGGVAAIAGGMLWLERTRSLMAADVHLGYEEVIGGALPLWSTQPSVAALCDAAQILRADEIILLGDVIHGAHLSPGASRRIVDALRRLRLHARLEIIAGNHEGRTRGAEVLGLTHERLERGGWLLLHGDQPTLDGCAIIGHVHPSLHLGGKESVPVFLASPQLVIAPAMTPYSSGLDVRSDDCIEVLSSWGVSAKNVHVVAALPGEVLTLGTLSRLRTDTLRGTRPAGRGYRRKFLQPDH
ncbi:MAG: hypothetical protein JOZ59_00155 [Candidatus Eremiobacteraeota bacterium]|nr:hypothetical protein [Candidatus Eremiobacteraeota bacterium]